MAKRHETAELRSNILWGDSEEARKTVTGLSCKPLLVSLG